MVADAIKNLLPSGSGLGEVYATTLVQLDFMNLIRVITTLETTFKVFLGGAMASPIVFILSIIGLLSIPNYQSRFNRILLSWVIVASAGILFTGFSEAFLQSRVLYIIPFQVFTAMGFLAILRYLASVIHGPDGSNSRLAKMFIILSYISVYAMFLSYAVRTVGFLYTGIF